MVNVFVFEEKDGLALVGTDEGPCFVRCSNYTPDPGDERPQGRTDQGPGHERGKGMNLMNPKTGAVQSREDWEADARSEGWDMAAAELVAVRKNRSGDWTEAPGYCSQNGGDCLSCSLVSYGRDCRNEVVA